MHDLLFGRPETTRRPDEAELRWLRGLLVRQGYAPALPPGEWDEATEAAAWALYGTENLEERWVPGGQFDPVAVAYLRERYPD
ncbi:putative peptidoglycan binding domain-containing protein [Deinococcus malanensis]|uniref:putative peptidoglycan binding domain-containing protein n=1 Tax=Deinococcus malanensis TaxID=1706855 RepID=UPI00363DFF07